MKDRGETQTDPNAPEGPDLDEDFWKNATLVLPNPKRSVHLRVDQDVFDWFKSQGKGHLTRMSAVLRSYYESQRGSR